MLTKEQRQLLQVYPAAMIANTVVDPDAGISAIKAGQCGGTRHGSPIEAFNTTSKGLVAGWYGEDPIAMVTWTQLKQWARDVPTKLREQIAAVRLAEQAENARSWKWCHCGKEAECHRRNEGDQLYGNRHHPTDEEYEAHLEIVFDLRDQMRALLDEALGLGDEPVGQLDLFEELMG